MCSNIKKNKKAVFLLDKKYFEPDKLLISTFKFVNKKYLFIFVKLNNFSVSLQWVSVGEKKKNTL